MEIELLKYLQSNPAAYPNNQEYEGRIKPISPIEIQQLEVKYNNGQAFPKVLKELLFLAGNYCYVLDYNIFDTQEELQDAARSWLLFYNRNINRNFFVVDAYNAGNQFLFIYLDEGDDPIIRQAYLPSRSDIQFITSLLNKTLSQYIEDQIDDVKQGHNPF
ncbi:hypothetical protein J2786_000982 [Chryseobacterium vietnamense]|uniref:Uncharacterized protein n=1 Tax=Chryseobacterium vietnamense TaxID=866785 RepID=A0ACC6J4W9_9FLAO|nr:hypothetical protein [Chryseobacterium vietnamense]MDR6457889.1 hypothetical protein [Chryseobacterium vietnamense]